MLKNLIIIFQSFMLCQSALMVLPSHASGQFDHQLQFLQFDSKDGLASNMVNDMEIDDQGYVWMTHDNMISRFDGSNSLVFASSKTDRFHLPASDFQFISKDPEGNLWISTNGYGLIHFDPVTFEYTHFQHNEQDSTSIPTNHVNEVTRLGDDDYLIGTTQQGILRFKPSTKTFRQIFPCRDTTFLEKTQHIPNSTRFFIQDPFTPEIHWTITGTGFLEANFEQDTFTYYALESNGLFAMRDFILHNGKLYGLSWIEGLIELDLKTKKLTAHYCPDIAGMPSSCRGGPALISMDDTTIMMASSTGTYLFDVVSHDFEWYDSRALRNKMPSTPWGYYHDRQGQIWVHTLGDGIYVLPESHQDFQHFQLEGHMTNLVSRNNQIFLSNFYDELVIINPSEDSVRRVQMPYIIDEHDNYFRDVTLDPTGQVYLLDGAGIWRFNEKHGRLEEFLEPKQKQVLSKSGYYWNMHFENEKTLWLGSQGKGLLRLDLYSDETTLYNSESKNSKLNRDYALSIILEDTTGRLWMTADQGLSYIDLESRQVIHPPWPLRDSTGQVVFDKYQRGTVDQEGNIWLAQDLSRLARVTVEKDQVVLHPVEVASSLPPETVYALKADLNGDIWLASENGLARYKVDENQIEYFGPSRGVGYTNALTTFSNGEMLASTSQGFIRFHPDQISLTTSDIPTVISTFKVFDEPHTLDREEGAIQLSFKQNFFAFEYAALDFESKSPLEYQYMLEGLDEYWIDAGDRTYAAYTNLDGGDYTFKVRSRRPYESWSNRIVSVPIHITTPFWKTVWFYSLVALCLFLLVWATFKYRENQIKERATLLTQFNKQLAEVEMKALRAQMNPHFLFNSLNAIKFFIQKNEKDKAEDYLNDFARLIRLVLNNSAKRQISLEDELTALELYIRIERMRFDDKFDYNIDIDEDISLEQVHIPPMILQPYVENAIWHGLMHKSKGRGKLLIALKTSENGIICTIEDNGVGRQKAQQLKSKSAEKKKSMGMKITRSRMDLNSQNSNLKFDIHVVDLLNDAGVGIGTRVVIKMQID